MSTSTPPVGRPSLAAASLNRGRLPDWSSWGVVGACAVLAVILLLATTISIGVLVVGVVIVSAVVLYVWSRIVEGKRIAADRGVTILVTASFG